MYSPVVSGHHDKNFVYPVWGKNWVRVGDCQFAEWVAKKFEFSASTATRFYFRCIHMYGSGFSSIGSGFIRGGVKTEDVLGEWNNNCGSLFRYELIH